jgi:membrane-bound lytic murein transglycosylase B
LKNYNNADKYALAVGLLADEIAGAPACVQDWKRPFTKLDFDEGTRRIADSSSRIGLL